MSFPGEFNDAEFHYREEHLRRDLHRGEGSLMHWVRAHARHGAAKPGDPR